MSLAANFFSENKTEQRFGRKGANIIFPGQKLFFTFASPPKSATDVHVKVFEDVTFLDRTADANDRFLGEIRGKIENRQFIPEVGKIRPPPPKGPLRTHALKIEIHFEDPREAAGLHVPLPEAESVRSHALRLKVEGTFGGRRESFTSKVRIHVHYPMAMIVPTAGASHDPSLDIVRSWSQQWAVHDRSVRKVVETPHSRLTRRIQDGDYDPLVVAFKEAAAHAAKGAGVIAWAVGHGDGGDSRASAQTNEDAPIPWFNMSPEDFLPPIERGMPFLYKLDVDSDVLAFGVVHEDGIGRTPPSSDLIKLRALDRIAEAIDPFGIRRIILHSCEVGDSQEIMQLVADRLQVVVRSHTGTIEYEGSGRVAAHYVGKPVVRPRDERQWPVSRLSSPMFPGAIPKRWYS